MNGMRSVAWITALVLHAGCMLDSRTLEERDAAEPPPLTGSDAGGAAAPGGMDAAQTDGAGIGTDAAAAPDAAPPGQCTRHEDCAVDIATCRIGLCNLETSRCEETQAADCVRCGSDTKVCVNGGCFEGGKFYVQNFDSEELPEHWSTSPDRPWTLTVEQKYAGDYSAVSGLIGNSTTTAIWLHLEGVPKGSMIEFSRRVSSERNYDVLDFLVNDGLRQSWSGNEPWDAFEYEVRAYGAVDFVWRYAKNVDTAALEDSAWIDNVTIWRRCGAPGQ